MLRSRRPGQALVEFALTLPLLLLLLTGIVDVGYLYNHALQLTNAVREGARVGALGETDAQVQAAVVAYLQAAGYTPALGPSDLTISQTASETDVAIATQVPLLFASSGPPITLKAAAHMRRE